VSAQKKRKRNSCFIHLCRRLVEDKRFEEVSLGLSLLGHSHLPRNSEFVILKRHITGRGRIKSLKYYFLIPDSNVILQTDYKL
jgi:hypothetical protein